MYVYVLTGYDQRTDDGRLLNSCEVQVYANSYEEALVDAKKLIGEDNKKEFWRVTQVIQKTNDA